MVLPLLPFFFPLFLPSPTFYSIFNFYNMFLFSFLVKGLKPHQIKISTTKMQTTVRQEYKQGVQTIARSKYANFNHVYYRFYTFHISSKRNTYTTIHMLIFFHVCICSHGYTETFIIKIGNPGWVQVNTQFPAELRQYLCKFDSSCLLEEIVVSMLKDTCVP